MLLPVPDVSMTPVPPLRLLVMRFPAPAVVPPIRLLIPLKIATPASTKFPNAETPVTSVPR